MQVMSKYLQISEKIPFSLAKTMGGSIEEVRENLSVQEPY